MYIPVAQCMKFVHKCDLCDVLTWSVDSSYSDAFGSMPYTCIYSLHSKVCILFINYVSIKQSQLKNPIKIQAFCIIMELWLLTSSYWIKTEVIYHVGVFSISEILFTRQDTGLEIAFHRWNISNDTMSQVIRPLTRWFFSSDESGNNYSSLHKLHDSQEQGPCSMFRTTERFLVYIR